MEEINDEVDALTRKYAEMIITRSLRGEPLPQSANGVRTIIITSGRSVWLMPTQRLMWSMPIATSYLHAKDEVVPARVITYIYMRADGTYMELTVATPNIDKSDLKASIAYWIVFSLCCPHVEHRGGQPLGYSPNHASVEPFALLARPIPPGKSNAPLQNPTRIREFQKLNETVERSVKRGEELYEQQKVFIGNASHEMQTPDRGLSESH